MISEILSFLLSGQGGMPMHTRGEFPISVIKCILS